MRNQPEALNFESSRVVHGNPNGTRMLGELFCKLDKVDLGRNVMSDEECALVPVDCLPLLPFSTHTWDSMNLLLTENY